MARRLTPLGSLVAALFAAIGLTACGTTTVSTNSLSGESKGVAQTVSDFQNDAQSRSNQKICDSDLAASAVAQLKATGRDCATVIKNQLNEADSFNLSLDSSAPITVTGNSATARVKSTSANKTRIDTLTLVKEGTRWKIASVGG